MEKRQETILEEVIASYIHSAEPVGSKYLVEKLNRPPSSATIRNELKALEEQGYLTQLHTSSGRVPTDEGYRWYVDRLDSRQQLSPSHQASLAQPLEFNMEQVAVRRVKHTLTNVAKAMSSIMDYTAIVMTPDIYQMALKMIHMVLVDMNKVLVVLLNKLGENQEFVVHLKQQLSQDELNKIARILTEKMEGLSFFGSSQDVLKHLMREFPDYSTLFETLTVEVEKLSSYHKQSEKLNVHGVSKMIQLPEFKNVEMTKKVLTELEEARFLTELISSHIQDLKNDVVIGKEFNHEKLEDCSLVVSPVKSADRQVGAIGVLGPKRMAYSYVIPMVKQISESVQTYIDNGRESIE